MARKLCSEDNYLSNFNLCAGKNVIGPISDIEHTSKNKNDKSDEKGLEEDDDDDDWEDDDDEDDFDILEDDDDFRRLKKQDDYSVIYDENTSARPAND